MKKKILLFSVFLVLLFLIGCKTTNNIENKSYNVNIDINDINEAFVPASEKGKEAVVGVSLYTKTKIISSWYLQATGSGAIYKGIAYMKDGTTIDIASTVDNNNVNYYEYYVITNAHVVNTNSSNYDIKIYLASIDTLVSAELLGLNAYEDLAVVKFTTSIFITPLVFSSYELRVGEIVLAVGNPLGYDYASTVTMGIVSNTSRFIEVGRDLNGDERDDVDETVEVIQHDAAINSGNSGGALINIKGEIVGINAMKVTDKNETVEGIGFAIPVKTVLNILDDMEKGITPKLNTISKATIYSVNDILNRDVLKLDHLPNIDLSNCSYTYGAYVYLSPSEEYGLISGDIVLGFNGRDIYNKGMLESFLRFYKGESITWKVLRNDKLIEVEYILK